MADVKQTPKIQCDNCGHIEPKTDVTLRGKPEQYSKPRNWGACKIEGASDADSYGNKTRLDMPDLCPVCASHAIDAAAKALKQVRGELERDGQVSRET